MNGVETSVDSLLFGAIDCYVHANPDLLVRRCDDIELARESAANGLSAVVHRHHFGSTAERSQLASAVTGFPILGALLLNDSVGGLNPTAVELALEMGACWIGLPTLGARAFRLKMGSLPASPFQHRLHLGPGRLEVTDPAGSLLSPVRTILGLVAQAGAVLNLGYVSFAEQLAVARAAVEIGHEKLVVTNPSASDEELDAFLEVPGLMFEITTYGIHPQGLGRERGRNGLTRNVELIGRAGSDRVILSSDGGMTGSPSPFELLRWAVSAYLDRGLTSRQLHAMVAENPRVLLASYLADG